jgi:hypothetical protein
VNPRTILFYGRSLLLSGVAASLEGCPGLRVLRATAWTEASRQLAEQALDALIFDLNGDRDSHILPLLLTHPHLTMIGLDTECNRAVLISGQETRSLTLDQLREMVAGGDAGLTG